MVELNAPAPNFSGNTINGLGPFNLADHMGSTVVISLAGLPWCGPCRREAPILQNLWLEKQSVGVQFVMINNPSSHTEDEVLDSIDRYSITFPVLGNYWVHAEDYSTGSLPVLYILTRDHRVHKIHSGLPGGTNQAIERQLSREIDLCRAVPTLEEAPGCRMAIRDFIRGIGRSSPSPSMEEHDDRSQDQ